MSVYPVSYLMFRRKEYQVHRWDVWLLVFSSLRCGHVVRTSFSILGSQASLVLAGS